MFLKTKQIKKEFVRYSKLGTEHKYTRKKTMAMFRCDNCNELFERELGKMDHRRLSNHYFHVCRHCDPKRFAQRKGVEKKRVWDLPVDSDIDISKI